MARRHATLFLLVTTAPDLASATVWRVPSDATPDLASAARVASDGDTVVVAPGYVVGSAAVAIDRSIDIVGDGASAPLPPLRVGRGATLTLRDVAFTASIGADTADLPVDPCHRAAVCVRDALLHATRVRFDGAGVIASDARIVLRDATFTVPFGSAVSLRGGTLDVSGAAFRGGTDSAIVGVDASVLLQDVAFEGIVAYRGPAVRLSGDGRPTATLDGVVVRNLVAVDSGGAFWFEDSHAIVFDLDAEGVTAGADGGLLAARRSDVEIDGARISDVGATGDGGAVHGRGGSLDLRDVAVRTAAAHRGGAIAWTDGAVTAVDLRVDDAVAWFGGALSVTDGVVRVEDSRVIGSSAVEGAAIHLRGNLDATILRTLLCGNVATADGSGLWVGPATGTVRVENSTLRDNTSPLGGPIVAASAPSELQLILHNDVLLGNAAPAGAIRVSGPDVDVANTAIVGSALGLWQRGGAASGGYNVWHDLDVATDAIGASFPTPTDRDVDPGFRAGYDVDCDAPLYLTGTSALRDAGDPDVRDADGTRSDVGVYGGPNGALPDVDEDGVGADLDCDDDDPLIAPGAEDTPWDGVDQDCDGADCCDVDNDGEPALACGGADCDDLDAGRASSASDRPYDGVDQDCDGVDLTDADGDGWSAVAVGGGDCDDGDAAVRPGADDAPNDGIDQDCNGTDRRVILLGGGGCDVGGSAGAGAITLAGIAAWRRRRAR